MQLSDSGADYNHDDDDDDDWIVTVIVMWWHQPCCGYRSGGYCSHYSAPSLLETGVSFSPLPLEDSSSLFIFSLHEQFLPFRGGKILQALIKPIKQEFHLELRAKTKRKEKNGSKIFFFFFIPLCLEQKKRAGYILLVITPKQIGWRFTKLTNTLAAQGWSLDLIWSLTVLHGDVGVSLLHHFTRPLSGHDWFLFSF